MKNFFTVRNYLGTIIDRYYAEDDKETINMILNMSDTTYSEDTTSYQLFCNRETNDLYFHEYATTDYQVCELQRQTAEEVKAELQADLQDWFDYIDYIEHHSSNKGIMSTKPLI